MVSEKVAWEKAQDTGSVSIDMVKTVGFGRKRYHLFVMLRFSWATEGNRTARFGMLLEGEKACYIPRVWIRLGLMVELVWGMASAWEFVFFCGFLYFGRART